ncbi:MAG: hypothetical protein ACRD3W_03140, partial [Terriglobales bacterium]
CQGVATDDLYEDARGFFRSYHVVADSIEEGLSFIRELEPSSIRDSIKVIKHKQFVKQDEHDRKGVYGAFAYSLWLRSASDRSDLSQNC